MGTSGSLARASARRVPFHMLEPTWGAPNQVAGSGRPACSPASGRGALGDVWGPRGGGAQLSVGGRSGRRVCGACGVGMGEGLPAVACGVDRVWKCRRRVRVGMGGRGPHRGTENAWARGGPEGGLRPGQVLQIADLVGPGRALITVSQREIASRSLVYRQ